MDVFGRAPWLIQRWAFELIGKKEGTGLYFSGFARWSLPGIVWCSWADGLRYYYDDE